MAKFSKRHISRYLFKSDYFFKSQSGHLLIIPYQLLKFQYNISNRFFRYLACKISLHFFFFFFYFLFFYFFFFAKGHNSRKGHNPYKKKIRVSYFFMRNPYMVFQKPSMRFKIMLCTKKKRNERTDGHVRSNMPSNFFEDGGINWLI